MQLYVMTIPSYFTFYLEEIFCAHSRNIQHSTHVQNSITFFVYDSCSVWYFDHFELNISVTVIIALGDRGLHSSH